ncbi:hypothetical protein HDA40_005177 [Hamadaea flava]|uniref:Uncharacterized protein n=1 Tax=Hamadaea flava TaxID=1742688 RepID=A0ABV8LHG8_9ACTN|nr:hypothetical protein [Hamadaea flava]MCP2326670.1 hypothetical protein [Hamadaea flava]
MRHVWSLLAGLIVAPMLVELASIHFHVEVWADTTGVQTGIYCAMGLLLGALACLQTSPVGPIVAGLLLVAPRLLATLFGVGVPLDSLGFRLAEGVTVVPWVGVYSPVLFISGVALLLAAASPSRWRGRPKFPPAASPVEPVVDTGRIDAVAAWRPFPADTPATAVPAASPTTPEPPGSPPLTGPWAPPPIR